MTGPFDLTTAPNSDPTALLRYRDGLYAVDLLACAVVHFDFFTWLSDHPSDLADICGHFGIHPRPTDVLLTLCQANDLVAREGELFAVTETAREHLVAGSPWFLGAYYDSLRDRPVVGDVLAVLQTGKPANWASHEAEDDWHGAMEQKDFAKMFTGAMDCRGVFLGQALARLLDLSGRRHLLDIGGGSGIYACCLVAANPQLRATVFEKPPVDAIASERIAERGLTERVSVTAGDFFVDPYPEDPEVHLLSNVLHDWDLPEVRAILKKSFEALPAGGLLVAHEAFLNAEKSGPLPVAEYSAILVTITQGRCYGVAEIGGLMEEAGFTAVRDFACAGDRSAIVASKPE